MQFEKYNILKEINMLCKAIEYFFKKECGNLFH